MKTNAKNGLMRWAGRINVRVADAVTSALGLSGTPSSNIWNVRGSEGFPIISGLGYQLGMGISIQTEAAANPLDNHSTAGLTDAGNDKDWEVAA